MLPIDDAVLEIFHSKELVLTPAIIAYNIDYSREEVNRRLTELADRGMVEKAERGKYRIADLGTRYIEDPVADDLAGQLRSFWRHHSR
ncbi:MarR family transcriptional regulator [Halomontanus rarus]|uniref:MarR family transcriptional regulator n=1 Tax=Halomontanus rarus TaxID=3034020 RepID=UPI0023E7D431|nr:MarR family transcriptional regulator [Halovivax sp. TS33]